MMVTSNSNSFSQRRNSHFGKHCTLENIPLEKTRIVNLLCTAGEGGYYNIQRDTVMLKSGLGCAAAPVWRVLMGKAQTAHGSKLPFLIPATFHGAKPPQ